MKKFAKAICSISVIIGIVFSQSLAASALIAPLYRGDANLDGQVTVLDATEIQKYLADLTDFSKRQEFASDVNGDDNISILDATLIQKRLAGLVDRFDAPDTYLHTVSINNFYASYDSGKAMAGTPVTFTAEATGGVAPFYYEFVINGEIVQNKSENNELTYTFEQAGTYEIKVKYYNSFDEFETYSTEYTVVDAYESKIPVISAIYLDRLSVCDQDTNTKVTVNAIFGTSPYEYSFNLDNGEVVQNFSDSNEFTISSRLTRGEHKVVVTVKDSSGNLATEEYSIYVEEAMPA